MQIKGFKAFNKDMTNRYNEEFEEGKEYTISGPLKFGNDGNGFHFCKRMEDTLRYFNAFEEEIKIAAVISNGSVVEYYDDYYGYYDMYATSSIFIEHIYTREEIINKFLKEHEYSVDRFLKGFKLTKEEINLFKEKYNKNIQILKTIAYYQENNKDIYNDNVSEKQKVKVIGKW